LDKEDVMFKKNRGEVRQREYHGLRSHIFLQQGDLPQTNLSITWVDVPPGTGQMLHRHAPEQVYIIIEGTGRMRVGEAEAKVVKGDLIYIPPAVVHAIQNRSSEMLSYISAATPPFDIAAYYDLPADAEKASKDSSAD
jgi:mannose-6-phosphate isomerase-like protein (cupin superfamily)